MKILNFTASNVHGYLDFNVNFLEDLNFLTGLNGTGKTTALNLIISLITPSFKTLITTNFQSLILTFIHNNKESVIICEKVDQRLHLSINDKKGFIDLHGLPFHAEDEDILVHEFRNHDVIDEIEKIPTPMFLDLDRRFIKNARKPYRRRKRTAFERNNHIYYNSSHSEENALDLGLDEVEKLIESSVSKITRQQLYFSEKFKKNVLRDSFKLLKIQTSKHNIPTFKELDEYKHTILSTLKQLDLLEDNDNSYTEFFESIENILKELISIQEEKEIDDSPEIKEQSINILGKWLINQPQLERVIRLSKEINKHQKNLKALEQEKDNFLDSINRFYEQTNKKINIKNTGKAEVIIKGHSQKDISYLSSGERQLLIILSHLYLNKDLPKSGVFIIDEPELSLHLLWQEMFVDEIIKARPDLQIILATHSPAIINDKKNKHVLLNEMR